MYTYEFGKLVYLTGVYTTMLLGVVYLMSVQYCIDPKSVCFPGQARFMHCHVHVI